MIPQNGYPINFAMDENVAIIPNCVAVIPLARKYKLLYFDQAVFPKHVRNCNELKNVSFEMKGSDDLDIDLARSISKELTMAPSFARSVGLSNSPEMPFAVSSSILFSNGIDAYFSEIYSKISSHRHKWRLLSVYVNAVEQMPVLYF